MTFFLVFNFGMVLNLFLSDRYIKQNPLHFSSGFLLWSWLHNWQVSNTELQQFKLFQMKSCLQWYFFPLIMSLVVSVQKIPVLKSVCFFLPKYKSLFYKNVYTMAENHRGVKKKKERIRQRCKVKQVRYTFTYDILNMQIIKADKLN